MNAASSSRCSAVRRSRAIGCGALACLDDYAEAALRGKRF